MGMQQIRDYYRVPATPGRTIRVQFNGQTGTITSAYGFYLRAKVDGQVGIYHPYDLDYLVDDEWIDSNPIREAHNRAWDQFNRSFSESGAD